MWLGFIPSDQVDALAAQIKAKQSKFYKGVANPAAQDLAQRVNSGFPLTSVANPTSGSGSGSGSVSGTGASDQVRRDAIIGVVSSLGAIAIIVLVVLLYHSMKRRKQLAHRRLSDPPGTESPSGGAPGRTAEVGVRPEGREFDRDSVGGSRRRSFYFAEDSLRGYEAEQEREREREAAWRASTLASSSVSGGAGPSTAAVLTNRRTVIAPGAISAPILRESSMNW